jgi:hypothetical protein
MERSSREWLVPLTGIVAMALLIGSIIVQGSPTSADHPPSQVAQWYQDNKSAAEISSFIGVVAAALLIFFGAYLRKVLEAAEGPNSMLPILAVIGLTIVAIGGAIDGMLLFAAAEAADDIPGTEIQVIQAIWDNDFLPFFLGVLVFLWSVGISVLRSGVLPKWLGWFAIVFGVVALAGPIGFIGALGAGVWVIIASIMLSMRARRPAAAAAATAP